jgi:hypothetical protein
MASTLPIDRAGPRRGKAAFANRAFGFAKPAARRLRRLPGFPLLWVASVAAAMLMIVTGAFGTGDLPLGLRTLFWALLLGWNLAKWQTWFALTVRRPSDWMWSALAGALLLNLLIPFEISFCLRAIGVAAVPGWPETWGRALLISFVLIGPIYVAKRRLWPSMPTAPSPAPEDGILARAAVSADTLVAVEAEDHYCRVHRQDGSSALVHYRFSDALAELAGLEGAQVHRGVWVAAPAVRGAVREQRRWRLVLSDGRFVPVSASHLGAVRSRGWLRRQSSTSSAAAPQSAVALSISRP